MAEHMLKMTQVVKVTGLSPSSIRRGILEGDFPSPRKLGTRAIGFLASEIEEWLTNRPKASPRNDGGAL